MEPLPLPIPGVTLRDGRSDDLPALHAIREAAFSPVFASFRALLGPRIAAHALADAEGEQARHLDAIAGPDSAHALLVAARAGTLIGFVSFTLDPVTRVGEIGLNAVHPDHAGCGLGTAMYRHVLDRMREAGMQVATVGTGGDASHAPARRAYAKAGFDAALPNVFLYRTL